MDLKEIKKLITLMNENGLCRLEIEEEGRRCVLEKPQGPSMVGFAPAMAPMPAMPHYGPPPPAPQAAKSAAPAASEVEDTVTFNSPMVGTFYRSPSPDAVPFVKVGDRVTSETTLCLIEAMKVFNEIKAEMSGVIVEIVAEDKEAVEYNQPLFLIRPA